ncbi:MAG: hypothetical protein ABI707_02875 [Ferruginibacter sp.]
MLDLELWKARWLPPGGLVHLSSFSCGGIRHVIGNLTRELSQKYSIEMKNERQMDVAFSRGAVFTNIKRIDLLSCVKNY